MNEFYSGKGDRLLGCRHDDCDSCCSTSVGTAHFSTKSKIPDAPLPARTIVSKVHIKITVSYLDIINEF
jgi:hypothetical protein